MHSLRRVYYIFFILQTLAWTSCQKNDKPSILVIAIDKFSSDMATCSDEAPSEKSGLNMLCKEAVRFTHSYTTSTHSAAAMASLLTAEYPFTHKLYRSFDRVSNKSETLAKMAKENNYVTSFFSGSPFILKKTGLSDYFDVFDDSIASSATDYEQDFKQQIRNFFQWHQSIRSPFLSIIYNSELNKISTSETDQSSFEKLDEKLYQFFLELKNSNIWDETYIIVVGLNGSNKFNRLDVNSLNNLHSENTNVATLIKIPRKKGDEGVNWKNDLRINLADVGYTLSCLLKACAPDKENIKTNFESFPILNLSSLWKAKNDTVSRKAFDRAILVQNTDTTPTPTKSHTFSILQDNTNFIQNTDGGFSSYNTISDKTELINLTNHKENNLSEIQKYVDDLTQLGLMTLTSDKYSSLDKANLAELAKINLDYWVHSDTVDEVMNKSNYEQNPLIYFYIQKYLKQKNIKLMNLKIQKIKTNLTQNNSCLDLTLKSKISKDDLKNCTDDLFLQYLLYAKAADLGLNTEKNKLLYSLMKQNYKNRIYRLSVNLANSNAWGLYQPTLNIIHPLVFIDPTFFEN